MMQTECMMLALKMVGATSGGRAATTSQKNGSKNENLLLRLFEADNVHPHCAQLSLSSYCTSHTTSTEK